MCHVKNQVQMANRTHPRAWLPGVAAPWQAQKRAQLSCPPTACCLLPPLVAVTTRLCSGHENRRGCCQGGTDSPFPLVSWHRFTNRFTPRLPSDSGHPGLRWSSSVTRLISLPLPCFTSVSHPASLLPHSARVCGDHLGVSPLAPKLHKAVRQTPDTGERAQPAQRGLPELWTAAYL